MTRPDSNTLSSTFNQPNTSNCIQYPPSSPETAFTSTKLLNPIVINDLTPLVANIQNHQQRQDLFSLLSLFYEIFDIKRHNIARTPIPHVINTVPHPPPASRPYPQPDKEGAIYKLIQEFLEASLISDSNSP